jgi:hypothetical protein
MFPSYYTSIRKLTLSLFASVSSTTTFSEDFSVECAATARFWWKENIMHGLRFIALRTGTSDSDMVPAGESL